MTEGQIPREADTPPAPVRDLSLETCLAYYANWKKSNCLCCLVMTGGGVMEETQMQVLWSHRGAKRLFSDTAMSVTGSF